MTLENEEVPTNLDKPPRQPIALTGEMKRGRILGWESRFGLIFLGQIKESYENCFF
jgi:hypothetical protein